MAVIITKKDPLPDAEEREGETGNLKSTFQKIPVKVGKRPGWQIGLTCVTNLP